MKTLSPSDLKNPDYPLLAFQNENVVSYVNVSQPTRSDGMAKYSYTIQKLRPMASTHSKLYDNLCDCLVECLIHSANMAYGHD